MIVRTRSTVAAAAIVAAAVATIVGIVATGDGSPGADVPDAVVLPDAPPPSATTQRFQAGRSPARPITLSADQTSPDGSGLDGQPDSSDPAYQTAPVDRHRGILYAAAADEPTRLTADRIGIDAPVVPVGLTADGSAQVPGDPAVVGWYQPLGPFDQTGSNVLVGHVNYAGRTGAFAQIGRMQPGDTVEVTLGAGRGTVVYTVDDVTAYPKTTAPLEQLYDPTGDDRLVLITCGGDFNRTIGHYEDNIVVVASPAG